jgi:FAD/FMN-containing dehydrogenase
MKRIRSWGGLGGEIATLARPAFSTEIGQQMSARSPGKWLVIGNLRSYGDEILCPDGNYLQTTLCDRILQIDTHADTVTAESGVRLDVLQQRVASRGYLIPVIPGTAYLTLGGAIANDVHGKNHHRVGTFGCFVQRLELIRTTGEALLCSRSENPELFAGTIGGMGLTGAITWATIQLRRIDSTALWVESYRFRDLSEFFDLDLRNRDRHEYAVAWVDCAAKGRSLGRGIFSVADHATGAAAAPPHRRPIANVPCYMPVSPLNRRTLSALNSLYFRLQRPGMKSVHCENWLTPLDAVQDWNRLYGRRGFFQFQCAVPASEARLSIAAMLKAVAATHQGSFLAVLKTFGDKVSPGLMSFPMAGATLALDLPNRGAATKDLLLELHSITASARGRLYPAKDACSPANSLEIGYPNFARFKRLLDPGLESLMSRRLQLTG